MADEENQFRQHNQAQIDSWRHQYPGETPYQALNVAQDASAEEVRKAFMGQARQHRGAYVAGDPEATLIMTKINSAYEILRDDELRHFYDNYEPPAGHDDAEVVVNEAAMGMDDIPPVMVEKLRDVFVKLQAVVEEGFDEEAFVQKHPHFYRSFFGFTFKGSQMAYAFNCPGFVYYTNRGTLLQKIFNIILLDAAGAGSGVVPEVICIIIGLIAFAILYCLYRSRGAQKRADPAHLLPYFRCVLYPIEFILLCITINISGANGAAGGIMAIIGIMNFWVCILLTFSNYQLMRANNVKEMQEVLRRYTGDPNAELHERTTDLLLVVDATMNGLMNRVVVSLSSFVVWAAVCAAAACDAARCLCSMTDRNNRRRNEDDDVPPCLTIIAFFWMIGAVSTCTHSIADKRLECVMNNAESAAGEHTTAARLYGYYEQLYYHRQLLFYGRLIVAYQKCCHALTTCCATPEGEPTKCERITASWNAFTAMCGRAWLHVRASCATCWVRTRTMCTVKPAEQGAEERPADNPEEHPGESTIDLEGMVRRDQEAAECASDNASSQHGQQVYGSVTQSESDDLDGTGASHGSGRQQYVTVRRDEEEGAAPSDSDDLD